VCPAVSDCEAAWPKRSMMIALAIPPPDPEMASNGLIADSLAVCSWSRAAR